MVYKICEEKRSEYFKAKKHSGNKPTVDNINKTKRVCKSINKCQSQRTKTILKSSIRN